jgi:hypothetical protein
MAKRVLGSCGGAVRGGDRTALEGCWDNVD